eukprot:TRINITY_DN6649_c0_g1_i1.p1 TRINITY_DN6649_c0_g1~~TRINITY_DN6649_c0_g1_i1.p1  ORF type:complete len:226 (+),score=51.89 TRINITY_DN6649_c0_g1_i1:110-787(+)
MKTALQLEQETTLGISRLEAALGGTFKMESANIGKIGGRQAPKFLKVSFPHGIGETKVDAVQEFSLFELKAILLFVMTTQGDLEKENFRPMKMASQSPRTFWSLVKHFGGDVEAGLKKLLPKVDWSFLDHRPRRQSEMAKKSEESKSVFSEAQKMYKQELRAKRESKKLIEEAATKEMTTEATEATKDKTEEVTSTEAQTSETKEATEATGATESIKATETTEAT